MKGRTYNYVNVKVELAQRDVSSQHFISYLYFIYVIKICVR